MYFHSIDESQATLVAVYTGARGPDDIGEGIAAMTKVHGIAQRQKRGALIILVPESDWPLPSSRERQMCAEPMATIGVVPNLVTVISGSAAVRGIITAVSWLTKLAGGNRAPTEVFGSMAELKRRIDGHRPSATLAVERMERSLRRPPLRMHG